MRCVFLGAHLLIRRYNHHRDDVSMGVYVCVGDMFTQCPPLLLRAHTHNPKVIVQVQEAGKINITDFVIFLYLRS